MKKLRTRRTNIGIGVAALITAATAISGVGGVHAATVSPVISVPTATYSNGVYQIAVNGSGFSGSGGAILQVLDTSTGAVLSSNPLQTSAASYGVTYTSTYVYPQPVSYVISTPTYVCSSPYYWQQTQYQTPSTYQYGYNDGHIQLWFQNAVNRDTFTRYAASRSWYTGTGTYASAYADAITYLGFSGFAFTSAPILYQGQGCQLMYQTSTVTSTQGAPQLVQQPQTTQTDPGGAFAASLSLGIACGTAQATVQVIDVATSTVSNQIILQLPSC